MLNMNQFDKQKRHSRRSAHRPRTRRLLLESLEGRNLLSGFTTGGLTLGPLVQVTGPSPFGGSSAEVEPYFAVNPTNPKNMVGTWTQDKRFDGGGGGGLGIGVAVTFNGGHTWQTGLMPGLTQATGGPLQVAFDSWLSFAPNGDLYFSADVGNRPAPPNKSTPSPNAILVEKSTDGGLTWNTPITLVQSNDPHVFNDKPSITADPTTAGYAYAVWSQVSALGYSSGPTMFSRTTDGGQSWETPRTIFDPGGGYSAEASQIVVLPDGTLINFMDVNQGQNSNKTGTLSVIRSTDEGQTWSSNPTQVAAIPGVPVTDPDTGQPVDGWVNGGVYAVAADSPDGKLYAVWMDSSFSDSQYDSIAFSMSADGGFTWSPPIQINQTPTNIPAGDRQAFLPSIAVAADGTVGVSYYDFRFNNANPGLSTDYWLVEGRAGTDLTNPANWRTETRLTNASFDLEKAAIWSGRGYFIGDYQGLAAAGNSFDAFFSMPNGTDPGDIFFRDPVAASGLSSASPIVNVNTDTEGIRHAETTIAVNPTNPLNMIGSANDWQASVSNGGQVFLTGFNHAHVTFDGGQTWTEYAVPFRGYNSTSDPAVSFDADGTAYLSNVAYEASENMTFNGNNPDLVVSHSTDGGQTWSTPVRVAAGTGSVALQSAGTFNDKPYLAAWGHGNAIVTWTQYHYGPTGIPIDGPVVASVTHDGGNTWTAPARISGPSVSTYGPNFDFFDFFAVPTVAVAADGSVSIYVAYQSNDNEVAPAYRDQNMVVKVDPATGQPLGAPRVVGLVYDGLGYDYPISVDGRETLQDSEFRVQTSGNITADPTNAQHLAVVWSDMRNSAYPLSSSDPYQAKTNADIIVSQSFDGGQTWSSPTAIPAPGDQFQPWAAYNSSGQLQIGYYDRSYDPANHQYGYTLASEKKAGSLKFTTQQVTTALSDPTQNDAYNSVTVNPSFPHATMFLGDYSGIAIVPGTNSVAALWTDMRLKMPNGLWAEDAFFALVGPPAGGSTATAPALSSAAAAVPDPGAVPSNDASWRAMAADAYFMDLARAYQQTPIKKRAHDSAGELVNDLLDVT